MSTLSSLNDVVTISHSNVPPPNIANALKSLVKREVGDPLLASLGPENSDPLAHLHQTAHTLAVLYILSARLNTQGAAPVPFEYIDSFCANFDPDQARLAPERVTWLAKGIEDLADRNQNPRLAIGPIRSLMSRYAPSKGFFTSLHVILLRICVKSECWNHALPILDVPLSDVDKVISDGNYLDNLTYYYLGGVIYAVLKRWKQAEEFFEMCVAAPGNIASAVQLEAFKKLTLVQLISYGKTRPLPKYVTFTTSRVLKQQPYQTFAKNYPNSSVALGQILEKDLAHFTADGNVGLMKQAIRHAPRWIVRRLTDTYVTLSVAEISKAIASDVAAASTPEAIQEATLLILSMIEQNEIYATLTPTPDNPAAAIVTFRDPPPPKYFDPAVLEKIVRDAQGNNTQLGLLDRDVGKSRAYLNKAVKDKEGGAMAFDDMAELEMERLRGDWD